jgi:hypothetical protein
LLVPHRPREEVALMLIARRRTVDSMSARQTRCPTRPNVLQWERTDLLFFQAVAHGFKEARRLFAEY